jgi:hypothetical protein
MLQHEKHTVNSNEVCFNDLYIITQISVIFYDQFAIHYNINNPT